MNDKEIQERVEHLLMNTDLVFDEVLRGLRLHAIRRSSELMGEGQHNRVRTWMRIARLLGVAEAACRNVGTGRSRL